MCASVSITTRTASDLVGGPEEAVKKYQRGLLGTSFASRAHITDYVFRSHFGSRLRTYMSMGGRSSCSPLVRTPPSRPYVRPFRPASVPFGGQLHR